jgi:hypothetical protein
MIEGVIADCVGATGLSDRQVRSALAGALGLLQRYAAPDKLKALYDATPGAEALARSPEASIPKPRGLLGGIARSAGGASGAAMADALALMRKASEAGVDRTELKALLRAAEASIEAGGGRHVLREALASMPGVGTILSAKA